MDILGSPRDEILDGLVRLRLRDIHLVHRFSKDFGKCAGFSPAVLSLGSSIALLTHFAHRRASDTAPLSKSRPRIAGLNDLLKTFYTQVSHLLFSDLQGFMAIYLAAFIAVTLASYERCALTMLAISSTGFTFGIAT